MEDTVPEKKEKTGVLTWLKKRITPLAGLLVALVVIVTVAWLYLQHREYFDNLKNYGYLGAFLISVVLNATVIIPVSNITFIITLGGSLPLPWLVGVAGGLGAGIGEMTGYLAGRSSRGLLAKNKIYNRVEGWVKKRGWLAVFILSIVPFAFDVVGIIAGALRMPVWRFFLACWLGRTISYVTVAYLSAWGFEKILQWFS